MNKNISNFYRNFQCHKPYQTLPPLPPTPFSKTNNVAVDIMSPLMNEVCVSVLQKIQLLLVFKMKCVAAHFGKKIDARIGLTYKIGHFYLSNLVKSIRNKLWNSPDCIVAGIWKVISWLIYINICFRPVSGEISGHNRLRS